MSSSPGARRSRAVRGTRPASHARAARDERALGAIPALAALRSSRPALSWAKVITSPSGSSRRGVLRSPHSTGGAIVAPGEIGRDRLVRADLGQVGRGGDRRVEVRDLDAGDCAAQDAFRPRDAAAERAAARLARRRQDAEWAPAGRRRAASSEHSHAVIPTGERSPATAAACARSPLAARRRPRPPGEHVGLLGLAPDPAGDVPRDQPHSPELAGSRPRTSAIRSSRPGPAT